MKKTTSHFTLVELLAVIAIIAMLGSMLFPTLGKTRFTRDMTQCKHNEKQFGGFFADYTATHDGILFPSYKQNSGANIFPNIMKEEGYPTYYYDGAGKGSFWGPGAIYLCPWQQRKPEYTSYGLPYYGSRLEYQNITVNGETKKKLKPQWSGTQLSSVVRPSATVYLADISSKKSQWYERTKGKSTAHSYMSKDCWLNGNASTGDVSGGGRSFRHNGDSVTLFVDGHVDTEHTTSGGW